MAAAREGGVSGEGPRDEGHCAEQPAVSRMSNSSGRSDGSCGSRRWSSAVEADETGLGPLFTATSMKSVPQTWKMPTHQKNNGEEQISLDVSSWDMDLRHDWDGHGDDEQRAVRQPDPDHPRSGARRCLALRPSHSGHALGRPVPRRLRRLFHSGASYTLLLPRRCSQRP